MIIVVVKITMMVIMICNINSVIDKSSINSRSKISKNSDIQFDINMIQLIQYLQNMKTFNFHKIELTDYLNSPFDT
jgi:hypothetical protein